MIPQVYSIYSKIRTERRLNANNNLAKADYMLWKVMQTENRYNWDKFATFWADED